MSSGGDARAEAPSLSLRRVLPGPLFFLATLLIPAPSGFEGTSWPVLGLAVWMALWWALEAVPLAATALLPIVVVPLIGVPDTRSVIAEYANASVLLILGGFLVALAMERWQLHRRMAFAIMSRVGTSPRRLVFGMMLATGFISMWVSNTSSALMMLPVAIAIAAVAAPPGAGGRDLDNFRAALLLAVAYGATIGGMGTLIGTPTNALVQGFMSRNFGVDITFVDWLAFGLPTVALLLPTAWLLLVRVGLPFDPRAIRIDGQAVDAGFATLGPMSPEERRVAWVAAGAALLWLTRPWLNGLPGLSRLDDTVIAVAAGLSLFLVPSTRPREALLRPVDLERLPWAVLLLFGGGLALAAAIQESTLAQTLGVLLAGLGQAPLPLLILMMVLLLIVWTEINSNVSTAATFMPIMAAVAAGSEHSVLALVAPAAMAASAGFMLPVGTPANALVFGSGRVSFRQMLRAGWSVNLAAAVIISAVGYLVADLLTGR